MNETGSCVHIHFDASILKKADSACCGNEEIAQCPELGFAFTLITYNYTTCKFSKCGC